jgi:uncharacterized protein YutE (UPF0331/DUF86 family)
MNTDDLPPDRANRIADGIEDIERNVTRLRKYQGLSREEYGAPGKQDRRDAIERKFEKLTEAMLDVASELCKQERGEAPEHRKGRITVIEDDELVSADLADRLRTAVSFRDVLALTYGPIVNDDIVFDSLQNDLARYVEFVEAVDEYLASDGE